MNDSTAKRLREERFKRQMAQTAKRDDLLAGRQKEYDEASTLTAKAKQSSDDRTRWFGQRLEGELEDRKQRHSKQVYRGGRWQYRDDVPKHSIGQLSTNFKYLMGTVKKRLEDDQPQPQQTTGTPSASGSMPSQASAPQPQQMPQQMPQQTTGMPSAMLRGTMPPPSGGMPSQASAPQPQGLLNMEMFSGPDMSFYEQVQETNRLRQQQRKDNPFYKL